MPVTCYSQRILNPFRGVMNIISIGGADAVTIDGNNWTLYVHDDFDCPTDDPEEFFEIEMPDIRFADWSKESGLKHSPLIASYHYNEIHAIGQALLEAIEKFSDQCPFAFEDKYELWLLDSKTQEPLALLDSVCKKTEISLPENLTWEAGLRCKQKFLKTFSPLNKSLTTGDLLNQIINLRAGKYPSAQWFYRNQFDYGKGLHGINLDKNLVERELSARLFPKLLVQQQWFNPSDEALIHTFICWLSPYLLVLDFLHDTQRETLEQFAQQQALIVDKMCPMYPKIINQQAINAARVEAVMRKSNTSKTKDKAAEAIEYIETQHSLI
ncbi:hypothetical protein MNBD_GAMMA06-1392 [hydrothermal vent metagenome]|uniref:Uncharacterized protein n=1 Tax=hydrothermal vent metagenome TaxID=652676 RepID=A0A3B0WI66_9ZZZZ